MLSMKKKTEQKDIEAHISEVLTRGVGTLVDPGGSFKKKLVAKAKGEYKKDIIIKFGVDPTRPDIHLGHAVVLRKLRQMQDLGCKVVFLLGDYTAKIGDPTGKSKVRPEVETNEIEANMKTYLDQVGKILSLDKEKFSWIRNSDWYYVSEDLVFPDDEKVIIPGTNIEMLANSYTGKAIKFQSTRMQRTHLNKEGVHAITMLSVLRTLKHITHAQLIERDMFQERLRVGQSLFMHEMLYPVFQGIDSQMLSKIYDSCDLEVGGTDQTFNMLMGRKVMEVHAQEDSQEPQGVLSFELLVGLDGKEKMSKSLDNYVGITDVPVEMFGKIMSIPDSAIASYFELCTFTPVSQIEDITKRLTSGKVNPRDSKMDLAQQIVEIYHGRAKADEARITFVDTFQNKKLPDDMPEAKVEKGVLLVDVLIGEDVIDSKSEFRRLMGEGAIRKDGEEKLTDPAIKVENDLVLKVGKHRFIKITVK